MKFSCKTGPDGRPVVRVGKETIPPERLAGLEFKAMPNQVPHVVLVIIPSDVELDADKALVSQIAADEPPAPPAPPAKPNRAARRAKPKPKK